MEPARLVLFPPERIECDSVGARVTRKAVARGDYPFPDGRYLLRCLSRAEENRFREALAKAAMVVDSREAEESYEDGML